jgi:phospholipid/cholesterol/gamma-HCH transport system substrate-binding protein
MSVWNSPEFKVGAMVIAVSGLIGYMSIKVTQGPGLFSGAHKYSFVVDNAGGLVKNSAVKMAGIKVGTIDKIELDHAKARITLSLDKDVPMTASTHVELRTDGILGDRHVELVPGNPDDTPLADGSTIKTTVESNGFDDVMKQVGKIAKNLNTLTETLNKATQGVGDDSTPVGRIILNIEKVSQDLAKVTDENRDKIGDIIDRVKNLTANLDKYINSESLGHLKETLKNVDDITGKINKGQGTIGKLINDETTVDEINTAVANVNNMLGGFSRWETSVDFHSEYQMNAGMTKSYLALRLQPGLDRYYELLAAT